MTAIYEKRGIKFLYPENWALQDEANAELSSAISLEAPGGAAFWSVHLYERDADADEILTEATATLAETYEDLETTPSTVDLGEFPGEAVECMFYCLDFLIRVRLQVIATPANQALFWYQAEDRDFEKYEQVFQAIALSLLQNVAGELSDLES